MKTILLLALVALAYAKDHDCVPKPVSNIEPIPPASIAHVTDEASATLPSLSSDITIVEQIVESTPTFQEIESTIEYYAKSHYDLISTLEYYDEYPSAVTSPTREASLVTEFPTLAKAVSSLVSEEATHSSLLNIQASLQTAFAYYSTVLTAEETAFEFSHASLVSVEKSISAVEVSSPHIVTDVEVLTTMLTLSPSLTTDVAALTSAAHYYPTALHELTTARDWTDTNAWYVDSTLKSIASCYPTLYSAVISIDDFLSSHPSDDSAFTSVVTALTYEASIITDVTDFETSVSTSLTQAIISLSPVVDINSHVTTDVTYVKMVEASHPSLSCAEGTIERDIVSHPSTVSDIELAVSSPSAVTNTAYVSSLEARYPSILTAIEDITSAEASHPSLSYVQSQLESDELVVTTLLTDAEEVISATSPSLIGDASDLDKIESLSPTITTVLHSLETIFQASPSLSCAESEIADYASSYATVLYTLEVAINSPSSIAVSSISTISELTAEYPSLASAIRSIISAEYTFPQLTSIQSALTFVLTYEPSAISVYNQLEEYSSIVSGEVCSFAPSSASSS